MAWKTFNFACLAMSVKQRSIHSVIASSSSSSLSPSECTVDTRTNSRFGICLGPSWKKSSWFLTDTWSDLRWIKRKSAGGNSHIASLKLLKASSKFDGTIQGCCFHHLSPSDFLLHALSSRLARYQVLLTRHKSFLAESKGRKLRMTASTSV